MKKRRTNYIHLWLNKRSSYDLRLANNYPENYYKKCLDNLCMKADLCESLPQYIEVLCDGMVKLIDMGISRRDILKHPMAFAKILRLGEDILEYSERYTDMFYLGLFVELHINKCFTSSKFYHLIKRLVGKIKEKIGYFSDEMINHIKMELKKENYALYCIYFSSSKLKLTS